MTAVVLVFAAKRVLWLTNLIRSGQKTSDERRPQGPHRHAHHHPDQRSLRANPAAELVDPRHRPLLHHVGLLHPGQRLPRGVRRAVRPRIRTSRSSATGTRWASCRTSSPLAVLLGIATFAIIRMRTRAQGARPRLPVLRLAHRRRLADPVHDLQRHLDLRALPRRRGEHREPARTAAARSSRTAWAGCCTRWATPPTRWIETVALLLHIGVMLVFLLIVLHSKHLHIGLAPGQRHLQAAARRPGPAAADGVQGRAASTSRIPPRTRCSAAARSRTSPGRATSTSPPAPSAAAASRSARRGTPESRCLPSSSS